jgi:hypothetical protein
VTFERHDSDVGEIQVDNPGIIHILIGGSGRTWQTASPLQARAQGSVAEGEIEAREYKLWVRIEEVSQVKDSDEPYAIMPGTSFILEQGEALARG